MTDLSAILPKKLRVQQPLSVFVSGAQRLTEQRTGGICSTMHKVHGQTQDTCSECQNASQLMASRTLYETGRTLHSVCIFIPDAPCFCVSHVDSLPCGCISYNPRLVDSNSAAGTSVPSKHPPPYFQQSVLYVIQTDGLIPCKRPPQLLIVNSMHPWALTRTL